MSRLLLDTHVFLWWVADDPNLTTVARRAIADVNNECFLSLASCWEMAIKSSLGKLRLAKPVGRFVTEQLAANSFTLLNIELRHAAKVEKLPFHHRDPFDRLLYDMFDEKQPDILFLYNKDINNSIYDLISEYNKKCVILESEGIFEPFIAFNPAPASNPVQYGKGIPVFKLFEITTLCSSGSEARRLIEQGGGYLNGKRLENPGVIVTVEDFRENNTIQLTAGKKKFHRVKLLDKNR